MQGDQQHRLCTVCVSAAAPHRALVVCSSTLLSFRHPLLQVGHLLRQCGLSRRLRHGGVTGGGGAQQIGALWGLFRCVLGPILRPGAVIGRPLSCTAATGLERAELVSGSLQAERDGKRDCEHAGTEMNVVPLQVELAGQMHVRLRSRPFSPSICAV